MAFKLDTLIDQIKASANSADASARKQLQKTLRDLLYSLEDEDDFQRRVAYGPLDTACVRMCIQLKVFETLNMHDQPVKVEYLAREVGAQPRLLDRILRYLAALGFVAEVGRSEYKANALTKRFDSLANRAVVCHMWDTCAPTFLEMPQYFEKHSYVEPSVHNQTLWQDAHRTELDPFAWFQSHPDHLKHFNDFMAARRGMEHSWLSVYPVEEETKDWPADRPVFVNMGGSIGHQCADFKSKFPNISGKVILQDLPHTVAVALQTPGVENMSHDFTRPQPVKGAKFYFLRAVLHDHPDEKDIMILNHIRDAMANDSVLLIDEMVLPETGTNANVAGIDLAMMCTLSSRERTLTEWESLFGAAGLRIEKKLVYNPSMYETILKVVKA